MLLGCNIQTWTERNWNVPVVVLIYEQTSFTSYMMSLINVCMCLLTPARKGCVFLCIDCVHEQTLHVFFQFACRWTWLTCHNLVWVCVSMCITQSHSLVVLFSWWWNSSSFWGWFGWSVRKLEGRCSFSRGCCCLYFQRKSEFDERGEILLRITSLLWSKEKDSYSYSLNVTLLTLNGWSSSSVYCFQCIPLSLYWRM